MWSATNSWPRFIVLAVLLGCKVLNRVDKTCSLMTTIAGDSQKMRYTKEWIASHLSDNRLREGLLERGSFNPDNLRIRGFSSLDWK
jgi:hypothetical protein